MTDPVALAGARILVTGPTGQVARPVVARLARDNEVYALARFSDDADQAAMRELGATPVVADLAAGDLAACVPAQLDYVLNYAVLKSGNFQADLAANAEGVGRLMMACRGVKAFVHFSSAAVYQYGGHAPRTEDDALGDNHRFVFPTYSISKIAAETVVRFVAREFGIPATIARFSVPYGDNGGWPYFHLRMMAGGRPIDVHPDRPNRYNLLHEDDYIQKIPGLIAVASTAATTLNFGGSQQTSIEEWCEYLGELTGLAPVFQDNLRAFGSLAVDTTRMHGLIGPTSVDWHAGVLRMVRALAPELLKPAYRS